jgi:hypothetical protein
MSLIRNERAIRGRISVNSLEDDQIAEHLNSMNVAGFSRDKPGFWITLCAFRPRQGPGAKS